MKGKPRHWRVTTKLDDITEGLFGQVVLYVFEVLPFLERAGVAPSWQIRSRLYGSPPDFLVLPGVFDARLPAPPTAPSRRRNLLLLRNLHRVALGHDWPYLHALWSRHFEIPARVLRRAEALAPGPGTLGLHFRGTDKVSAHWDTNPVSHADFLALTADFLRTHPEIERLFVATDDAAFLEAVRDRFARLPIATSGVGAFHKDARDGPSSADHALLDCVLLSRCRWVLKTSSALSAFAKVLNPELAIFRVAASKLFDVMPYFPVAYIPRLRSSDPECARILERLLQGDWLDDPVARAAWAAPFRTREVPVRDKIARLWRHYRPAVQRRLGLGGARRRGAA
jgi:hypothetical protein